MGQVLVPLLLGGWLFASAWGSDRLVKLLDGGLRDKAWQLVVQILAFVVLLPLPLADELLAKPRFDALCRDYARLEVHLPESLGPGSERVRLRAEAMPGLGLAVEVQPWWVMAHDSHLVAASYVTVQARGGWLARWTHPENPEQGPLTFRGSCEPADLEGRLQPRLPRAPHGASVGQADETELRATPLVIPAATGSPPRRSPFRSL